MPRKAFFIDELVRTCWKFVSQIEIRPSEVKSPVESGTVMPREDLSK